MPRTHALLAVASAFACAAHAGYVPPARGLRGLRAAAPPRASLVARDTDPSLRTAASDAFDRHRAGADALDARQFRRAMRHAGVDMTREGTQRMIDLYGDPRARTVSRADLEAILAHSTVASPSRYFWIPADPRGEHLRVARPRWNRFGHAGIASPLRVVHYALGAASIALGTWDAALLLASAVGGAPSITDDAALAHALVHAAAAYASLPRFRYRFDATAPWKLWLPTARDASMWPAFLQNTWLCVYLTSDLVRPPGDALVSCHALTASACASLAIYVYSNYRAKLEERAEASHVESFAFSMLNSLPPRWTRCASS